MSLARSRAVTGTPVNKVFALGLALLIGSYVARLSLMTSDAWMRVATWLTSFV